MKKFIIKLSIFAFIFFSFGVSSYATNNLSIIVNNSQLPSDYSIYLMNNRAYASIRAISELLKDSELSWDAVSRTAHLSLNDKEIALTIDSYSININNVSHPIDAPIKLIDGKTYVPVRHIFELIGYSVNWESTSNSVYINNSEELDQANYSDEDLYWLSRIIEAEAKGEPYEGKLAVGNVIINRRESSLFPNTVKKVIFDKKYGIQFTPSVTGTIYNSPSEESIKAAKAALNGENNIGQCLYFCNPKIAQNSWIANNRPFYTRINNHNFYS